MTGYLMWDDSADVGSTVQYFSKNGFHQPCVRPRGKFSRSNWNSESAPNECLLEEGAMMVGSRFRVEPDSKQFRRGEAFS